jgi:hypothetical protein
MTEPGIFEIIRATRAMRRLKPGPAPDELIVRILQAGVCAPSAGNGQNWRFPAALGAWRAIPCRRGSAPASALAGPGPIRTPASL